MVDLPGAVSFLIAAQRADGGWGYRPGGMAVVEPTAFALLALRGLAAGRESYRRGQEWLAAQQRPDGAFGAFPGDSLPSWMTAPAALALRGSPESERALDWLVQIHQRQPVFNGD